MTGNLYDLPMTEFELILKRFALSRPEIMRHIPNSTELAEYTRWMAEEYGAASQVTGLILPGGEEYEGFYESARKAINSNEAEKSLDPVIRSLSEHREGGFIREQQDISAARMIRYLPSHWHTSDFVEVYYDFGGDCPIYFQNETVMLRPGSVMIVSPSAVHASPCFSDDAVLLYCLIRSSTFERIFFKELDSSNILADFFRQALSGGLGSSYLQFDTGGDEEIRRLMFTIYRESQEQEAYSSRVINGLMNVFFALVLRRYEGTARLPRTDDFYWRHEFSAILSYLQTHFATVSAEELGERFHYSRRQINRIIKSCMGMSYQELVLKLKMERALALLKAGDRSTADIAASLGYSSVSSFYRAYTKYYGTTPRA